MKKPAAMFLGLLSLVWLSAGCADDDQATPPEEEKVAASSDELQSATLKDNEMREVAAPEGMPKPWEQPDSTGWFGERGKCGPTAVANALKLYKINNVSPTKADEDGVNWIIGTRGISIRNYMQSKHPQLGCTLEHPQDGKTFLRNEIKAGHPVMVWFNTAATTWYQPLQSHWVVAVDIQGQGANEDVIVMSWGKYYAINMTKLDDAWRNVYGIRRPSIVCDVKSTYVK